MNPLIVVELIKQGFKFGGSLRKEAMSVAIAPAVVAVYNSMGEACLESCTFTEAMFAPSGLEWSALITTTIALFVHLNQKRKDESKTDQGE
tara:strand:- start:440 stop:712 length:273 start_codon:yes stop_codon:yes gene_type:complete